jgi:hypothetical protein
MENNFKAVCTFCRFESEYTESDILILSSVFSVGDKHVRIYSKFVNCVQCKKEVLNTSFKYPVKKDS